MTTSSTPPPPDAEPVPEEAKPPLPQHDAAANTGNGAASALARMKQWERSRAKLREGNKDRPADPDADQQPQG